MSTQANPANTNATAAPEAEKLPTPKAAEKTPTERLDGLKEALRARISGRRGALDSIASLSMGSHDKAFKDLCAEAVGSFLTGDGTSTTDREYAAKTLATMNSPKAVQYLSTPFTDGQAGKYPTTVRAAAVRALIGQISLPMSDPKTREHALKTIKSVAERDRYDPRKEAQTYLARLEEIKRKNEGA
ncbi:MAG: hypothetical protein V1875_00825 [Candidatus Altiarchaeota archaeon]